VRRHDVLRRLHELARPRTYLEIGVNDGRSLALSSVRSIGIDPAFTVTSELRGDLHLVRATSDDFFARSDPLEHLRGTPLDLAFIDGMHLAEFALRDFINVERHATWSTVIVLDDQLPRNIDEAARDRHTVDWAGDVYKMIPILHRYRPDLRVVPLDTTPTGVVAVFGADPANRVLSQRYDEIVAEYVVADPQDVPDQIIAREGAVDAATLLDAIPWERFVTARDGGGTEYGRADLLADVERVVGGGMASLATWRPDTARAAAAYAVVVEAAEQARLAAEAAKRARSEAQAAKSESARRRRAARNDVFARVARAAPFLRSVPGARPLARVVRRARRALPRRATT
jgi:hypothetical protein